MTRIITSTLLVLIIIFFQAIFHNGYQIRFGHFFGSITRCTSMQANSGGQMPKNRNGMTTAKKILSAEKRLLNPSVLEEDSWTEEEVFALAIGDPVAHAQQLSSKVEAAIEEEWNRQVYWCTLVKLF